MAATDGGRAVRAPPSFVSGAASAWAAPNASPALSKAAAERWESAFTMSLRCHTPIFRRSLKILQNFHKMQEISAFAGHSLHFSLTITGFLFRLAPKVLVNAATEDQP